MSQVHSTHPSAPQPVSASRAWRVFIAPVYLAIAFVAMHLLDKHLPIAICFSMPWKMLGWVPLLAGCGCCAAGAWQFRRQRTTIMPRHPSRVLVTHGIYAISRNPMYAGMALILIGLSFIAGSASVWVVPLVFVGLIDRQLIRVEEAMLADRFGEAYRSYRQRVRRWV